MTELIEDISSPDER